MLIETTNDGDQPTRSQQSVTSSDPNLKYAETVANIRKEYLSEAQHFPWIIGFSGGKDSTLVTHAVFDMLLSIAPSRRLRAIHVVANDTLVESPLVIAHLHRTLALIRDATRNLGLPVTVKVTQPDPQQSFWVNLIGRGYPPPTRTMRWCTDRLKIQPTSRYILDFVSHCGSAIVVLGVRRDESHTRRVSIGRRENLAGTNLTPHPELPGAFIYRPIVDLSTDEVWEILASHLPP